MTRSTALKCPVLHVSLHTFYWWWQWRHFQCVVSVHQMSWRSFTLYSGLNFCITPRPKLQRSEIRWPRWQLYIMAKSTYSVVKWLLKTAMNNYFSASWDTILHKPGLSNSPITLLPTNLLQLGCSVLFIMHVPIHFSIWITVVKKQVQRVCYFQYLQQKLQVFVDQFCHRLRDGFL